MKELAARAGVSFQTASKVLNGKGSVSETTRARIVRTAQDLGYVPNRQARSLVLRRTLAVGVLAGTLEHPNATRLLAGAEIEAGRRGYAIVVSGAGRDSARARAAIRDMLERRIDGLLLAVPELDDDLDWAPSIPIVSLYPHAGNEAIGIVGCDHVLTGYLPTAHLCRTGRRTIASVVGSAGSALTRARLRGYKIALEEFGCGFDEELVQSADGSVAGAYEATLRLIERNRAIDAVFAHSDYMAMGVLSALRASGIAVPAICAVAGCDDVETAAFAVPPLTTVRVPYEQIGAAAMRALLMLVDAPPARSPRLLLPVDLIERESSRSTNLQRSQSSHIGI